jgi:hypothetical protein
MPLSRGRFESRCSNDAGPFFNVWLSSSQRMLLKVLLLFVMTGVDRKYGLTGWLPDKTVMGVLGRDTGKPGLVLALEGREESPPPTWRSPGLSPTLLHLGVSDNGLVRREEGLEGVWPLVLPLTRGWWSPPEAGPPETRSCRHFLTKLFARLARWRSEAFRRSSLMCLPRRLTCKMKEIENLGNSNFFDVLI